MTIKTDTVIIGAGPSGLFQVFEPIGLDVVLRSRIEVEQIRRMALSARNTLHRPETPALFSGPTRVKRHLSGVETDCGGADLQVLAALLAILGYSLNDTIIIYDRIRENMEVRTARDLPQVLNLSVNQTLSRTVLTSGTTLVALFAQPIGPDPLGDYHHPHIRILIQMSYMLSQFPEKGHPHGVSSFGTTQGQPGNVSVDFQINGWVGVHGQFLQRGKRLFRC